MQQLFGCLTTSLLPVFFFLLSLPPSSLWKAKHIARSVPGTGSLSGLRSLVAYYLHDDVFFSLWSIKNKHPVLQFLVMISPDHPELPLTPGVLRSNQDEVTVPNSSSKVWSNLKISTLILRFQVPSGVFLAYFVLLCGKIM